jgi:hypothetical protein
VNLHRIRKLIESSIDEFSLDLKGLTVLTEAASGYYQFTPMIAAMADAENVLALTRDSRFGKAENIRNQTLQTANEWNIANKIKLLFNRNDELIESADIVTNLGFVRPLDRPFLKRLKKTVVIPLMWETWEFRSGDIDLEECRKIGIPVLGTNEHHPNLRTFEYVGCIAIKLLMEVGIEVFRSKIAVLGEGEFCEHTVRALRALKASVTRLSAASIEKDSRRKAIKTLGCVDALVVVDHNTKEQLIGAEGKLRAAEMSAVNPALAIIHVCGGVDRSSLREEGIQCWPKHFAPTGYMSVATDYVGPSPLISLHTAGLKIGECLARARQSGMCASDAEAEVLNELDFAQGFKEVHK